VCVVVIPPCRRTVGEEVTTGAGTGRGNEDCAPRGEDTGEGLALLLLYDDTLEEEALRAGTGRGSDDCAPRGEDTGEGPALLLL
jgi:hypothetical protein